MTASTQKRPVEEVIIREKKVLTVSPEGQQISMDLAKLVQTIMRADGKNMDSCGVVLPDGVKLLTSMGAVTIWVYERPPQVYSLKWIASNSPAPYGRKARYRTVRIALPYLVIIAVFVPGRRNKIQLHGYNECFFRHAPLKNPAADTLFYPALLNCSKFDPPEGRPLSWICTEKLDYKSISAEPDDNTRMQSSLRALLHALLETGYNLSSEHHEASSWFTESVSIDPRVATIERWEQATDKDPLFVLDVPWMKTGLTLEQVIDRIFETLFATRPEIKSASDIQRIMFNHNHMDLDIPLMPL
jgi:hypothetical protein